MLHFEGEPNIHTTNHVFRQNVKIHKKDRQEQKSNKSFVIWFTGLSGSGKSSLANEVEYLLYQRKLSTYLLDGDNIRLGLNKDLGFLPQDRKENIRRIAEVSRLFVDAGVICLAMRWLVRGLPEFRYAACAGRSCTPQNE